MSDRTILIVGQNANGSLQNGSEFDSIEACLAKINKARAMCDTTPYTVKLTGDHFTLKPIIVDADTAGDDITIEGDENARIIGGVRLVGLKRDEFSGIPCISAEVPTVGGEYPAVSDLYVNGERYTPARYPKDRFLHAEAVENDLAAELQSMEHIYNSSAWFSPNKRDIEGMDDIAGASITFYHYWIDEHTPVARYDAEKNVIHMKYASCFTITTRYEPKEDTSAMRYYFENVGRGFTDAGEFYYDRGAGKIYFIPRGEVDTDAEAFVPIVKQLLLVRGVNNIKVKNIEFLLTDGECAFYNGQDDIPRASDVQAAHTAPGAVSVENSSGFTLTKRKIHATGTHAVYLGTGTEYASIDDNNMYDLGGGGVSLVGGTPDDALPRSHSNKITNNKITYISKKLTRAVGVLVRHSPDNEISGNEIAYTGYSGISVGWVWGYADSETARCLISRNHIHHIGMGLLSDMGGIYTLGRQQGTVIEYNRIHDVVSAHYGGWGIYNDEGSSGIRVENNVVFRTKCECYNQHYGKGNIVRNNIFALGGRGAARILRGEPHVGATLIGNVMVTDGLDIYYDAAGTRESLRAERNAVYDLSREVKMLTTEGAEYALADWQEKFKMDFGTKIINPHFADIENGDFTVRNPEIFEKIGFKPIVGFPATE